MAEVSSRSMESLLEHAAFARRLARVVVLDDARAEDVMQQTWLNALEHPPREGLEGPGGSEGREGRGLKSWLATVVRNTASKLRREESRRERREQKAATPESLPSTAEVAMQLAAQRELVDLVARLEEPYRTTIHLRFFEERTPTEIARAQSLPVRTVETRLRRAIAQLREQLDRRHGGREAWAGLFIPQMAATAATTATAGAGAIGLAGAVLVTTQMKVVGGAAAAVVLGALVWTLQSTNEPAQVARNDPPALPNAAPTEELAQAATAPEGGSTSASSGTTPERGLEHLNVSVVTEDGPGIPGALLLLFRDDERHEGIVLGDARTDEEGAAALPRVTEASELLVMPGRAPMQRVEVKPGATSLEVPLEVGAVLSGWVTVDGRRPVVPIELGLNAISIERMVSRIGTLPNVAARRYQELRGRQFSDLNVTTGDDGSFEFFGLDPSMQYSVRLPVPFEGVTTGTSQVVIDKPREDVELALRVNPTFQGRLVDRAGNALAGWKTVVWLMSGSGTGSQPETHTGEDGRFRAYLNRKQKGSTAALIVYDLAGVPMRRVDSDRIVDDGYDFGDVVVDAQRTLALDVRDPEGRPIDDFAVVIERSATAWEVHGFNRRFTIDAKSGKAGFGLPEEVVAVRVVVPGFESTTTPCEPSPTPRLVTLSKCSRLAVEVLENDVGPGESEGESTRGMSGATLEVSASAWPLAWTVDDVKEAHPKLGGSVVELDFEPEKERNLCRFGSADGRFDVLALRSGLPLTVVVRDTLGIEVLRETLTLAPGERRELLRTVSTPAFTVRGVVKSSADGEPIADAQVWLPSKSGWRRIRTQSGKDGSFRLDGVRATKGTLIARCKGYSDRWLNDIPIEGSREYVIELNPGRSLLCSLFGQEGGVVPDSIWIEKADSRDRLLEGTDQPPATGAFLPVQIEDRQFLFENLPESKLLLRASIEGFAIAHDLHGSEGNFNGMVVGPIEVDWKVSNANAVGRTLHALRLVPRYRLVRATSFVDAADATRGSGLARFSRVSPDIYDVTLVWSSEEGGLSEEKTDLSITMRNQGLVRTTLVR